MTAAAFLPSALKGETLPLYLWLPQGEPKGLIQLVHGMAEHMERYDEPARFLCERGYAVVGHTHAGHGPQASRLGFFGKAQGWDHLLCDLHQVRLWAQRRYPSLPYYLLGHSMGSFLVRCYLTQHPQGIAGAILSGTGYFPRNLTVAGKALSQLFILLGLGLR
ncbi:MAG: alpha/beta fold hydrolase, partial [Clostridia bacterium]|nr:alpha/beta fold hydrolase [Clostridia bacterium]